MRAITAEDLKFLSDLQDDLNTQDTTGHEAPRFWVVHDARWAPCWDGHAERFTFVEDGEKVGVLDWYRDDLPNGLTCVPERRVERNASNTFFMTKRECHEHIQANKHHYSATAHPYAMTAWRSSQVGRLWKLLQDVDWPAISAGDAS